MPSFVPRAQPTMPVAFRDFKIKAIPPPIVNPNSQSSSTNTRTSSQPVSAGFYVGIAVFIIGAVITFMVYSYFANPFPFHKLKAKLGLTPSRRTPISRRQILTFSGPESAACRRDTDNDNQRPESALCSVRGSECTLPKYTADLDFSKEVLKALMKFEVFSMVEVRSPSYKSKLSIGM